MPGVSTGKSAAGPDLSSTCTEPEMAYHKSKELREISRPEKEIFTYVDFLADFRGTFHDICNDTRFGHCLDETATALRNIWPENFWREDQPESFIRAFDIKPEHALFVSDRRS